MASFGTFLVSGTLVALHLEPVPGKTSTGLSWLSWG